MNDNNVENGKKINLIEIASPNSKIILKKAIVSKVNTLMTLCDRLEKEINQNKRDVEGLMQSWLLEVFEGKEIGEVRMAPEPGSEYGLEIR